MVPRTTWLTEAVSLPIDPRLLEALEQALIALRGGGKVDAVFNAYPDLVGELRPLVDAARLVTANAVTVPAAPGGLASGRGALLERAERARSEAPISEALDRAIAGVLAGQEPAHATPVELAGMLTPLLVLVQRIQLEAVRVPANRLDALRSRWLALAAALHADRAQTDQVSEDGLAVTLAIVREAAVAVPPAPGSLTAGRERLLIAAATARAASAQSAAPDASRPRSARNWLGLGLGIGGTRMRALASAAAFILAVVLGNALILSPVSASSLPGEPLYPVKRLNERIALAMEFDSAGREALRSDFSERRALELAQTVAGNGEKDIEDWEARFVDARRASDDTPEEDLGYFRVRTRGEEGQVVTTTLAWNARSDLSLGSDVGDLTDVTEGSEVRLWVRVRGSERLPLAYRVKLVALAEPVATPTVSPTPTLESPTETPEPSPTVDMATRTPVVVRPSPTPVLEASPVSTSTPVVTGRMTPESTMSRLAGILRSDPSKAEWQVRETHSDSPSRMVLVDASRILEKGIAAEIAVGHWVYLEGRWSDGEHTMFVARGLLEHRADACESGEAHGTVASYAPGTELVLAGGGRYLIDPAAPPAIEGPIAVDSTVDITYEDCGLADYPYLRTVKVAGATQTELVQGVLEQVNGDRLVLTQTTGIADPLTVVFDGSTPISPPGAQLTPGQILSIRGSRIGEGLFRAIEIEILQEPASTPTPTREGGLDGTARPPDPQPTQTQEALADASRPQSREIRPIHG